MAGESGGKERNERWKVRVMLEEGGKRRVERKEEMKEKEGKGGWESWNCGEETGVGKRRRHRRSDSGRENMKKMTLRCL